MTRMVLSRVIVILLFAAVLASAQQLAPVQVVRITAGPAGVDTNGVFTFTEERSVFSRTTDKQVIVLFQWEDVPGPHKLVAQWRSTDGGTTSSSAIDYNASESRFGAYWRIPMTADMPLGTWSLDATMDGRPAGRYTFEITDAKVEAALTRRPLTQAELYERLDRLFVVMRRGAADGGELEPAAGFLPSPQTGRIYTVMPAIEASATLRVVTSDGVSYPITTLVAANRRQQWAVVQGRPGAGDALKEAAYDRVKVGNPCFSMEGTAVGIRVLVVGTVTGQATANARQVHICTFSKAFGMPGAPVVDEYGDLLGIVGAGLPGDWRPVDVVQDARGALNGAPIIPFANATVPAAAVGSDLAGLYAAGDLMPAVDGNRHNVSGGFTRTPLKRGEAPPREPIREFSPRDPTISIYVAAWPTERVRGTLEMRLLDADNRLIAASKPQKVNFGKGEAARASWDVPTPKELGMYRADVVLDARVVWRGFVRVSP